MKESNNQLHVLLGAVVAGTFFVDCASLEAHALNCSKTFRALVLEVEPQHCLWRDFLDTAILQITMNGLTILRKSIFAAAAEYGEHSYIPLYARTRESTGRYCGAKSANDS